MDVVFSVATRDCFILRKTIKYVWQNIKPSHIYVITKITNSRLFSDRFLDRYCVTIIDEDKLCENLSFGTLKLLFQEKSFSKLKIGWYFQQFLKMGFALSKYAKDEYLIWDSDTIPLRPLSFKRGSQPLFTLKEENHKPYFDTITKLFGLNKSCEKSFIAEHMLIETVIMKEIIKRIEQDGKCWFETILDAIDSNEPYAFSEFETYGTFVTSYYQGKYGYQELSTLRDAGLLYGRCVTDKELKKLSEKYDTASFEAYHWPPKPRYYLCKVEERLLIWYAKYFS